MVVWLFYKFAVCRHLSAIAELRVSVTVNRLKTPLHVAADKGHFDLIDTLLKHGAKVVEHSLSILLQFLFIAAFVCVHSEH